LLTSRQSWWRIAGDERAHRVLESLLTDSDAQRFLGIHRRQEVVWFHQESFEELLWWLPAIAAVQISADPHLPYAAIDTALAASYDVIMALQRAADQSGYQVDTLLDAV
jgi:hypothetical protein